MSGPDTLAELIRTREVVVRLRAALDVAIGERDTARQERDVAVALREGRLR